MRNSLGIRLAHLGIVLTFTVFPLFAGSEAISKTSAPIEIAPATPTNIPLSIDNFESGGYKKWYVFDKITPQVIPAPAGSLSFGKSVLQITGVTESWYVGGLGIYVGKEVSGANAIEMYVLGDGPNSGKVKIEMTEDDNGNFEKEQDDKFNLLHDDNRSYELTVNWTGWKRIVIPFKRFSDTNPGVGNDVWDPNGDSGSGGLLTIQMIFLTPKQSGEINIAFDQIRLINLEN